MSQKTQNQKQEQDHRRSSFLFGYDLLNEKIDSLNLNLVDRFDDDNYDEGPLFSSYFPKSKQKKSASTSSLSLSSESSFSLSSESSLSSANVADPVSPASVFTDFTSSSTSKKQSRVQQMKSLKQLPMENKNKAEILEPPTHRRRGSLEYSPDFKLESRRKRFLIESSINNNVSNMNIEEFVPPSLSRRVSSHTISEVLKECEKNADDLLFDEEIMPRLPNLWCCR